MAETKQYYTSIYKLFMDMRKKMNIYKFISGFINPNLEILGSRARFRILNSYYNEFI